MLASRRVGVRLFSLVLLLVILTACDRGPGDREPALPYTVLSDVPYNESEPANTHWGAPGEMRCLKVEVLAANGSKASGSVQLSYSAGGSGGSSDYYECFPQGDVKLSVSLAGHTPEQFAMNVSAGRMLTIQVPLERSCSNQSYDKENEEVFFSKLAQLGLNSSEYTLTCMEYRPGRSSLMKGKGTTKDAQEFEFSFRTGWCSSGGADCGYSTCFSTRNPQLFKTVVRHACYAGDCERFIYRGEELVYSIDSYRSDEKGPADCLAR